MVVIVKQIGRSHVSHPFNSAVKSKTELKRIIMSFTDQYPPDNMIREFSANSNVSLVYNKNLKELYVNISWNVIAKTKFGTKKFNNYVMKGVYL